MNDWIRAVLGGVFGAIAMFAVGVLFWATPLSHLAYASLGEPQGAAVQQVLAANLPRTGRYLVPDSNTAGGTVLYGRGPVATIDFNRGGFAAGGTATMVGGFVQEAVASLMIAFSLFAIGGQVVGFVARLRVAFGLTAAATVMIVLSDPIFAHGPWDFAIYDLVACLAMLWAASFVIVRWFLPEPR